MTYLSASSVIEMVAYSLDVKKALKSAVNQRSLIAGFGFNLSSILIYASMTMLKGCSGEFLALCMRKASDLRLQTAVAVSTTRSPCLISPSTLQFTDAWHDQISSSACNTAEK